MSAGGSSSRSSEYANRDSFLAPVQAGFLQDMFRQAQGQTNPAATRNAAYGATGVTNPMMLTTLRNTAAMTDPSAMIRAQAGSLKAGLGDLFRTEINPAIQTDAIAAGGFGGGRQGVAEGVAAGQLADAYTQGFGDIVANARQTALGAASQMPGLSSAYYTGRVAPTLAGFDPLTQLASILGSPILLDRARAGQRSSSGSFDFGLI